MDNSLDAFVIFKNSLKLPKKYRNGNQSFKGDVIYKANGQEYQDLTKVTLKVEGHESGNICIEETSVLRTAMPFFEFRLDYQYYTLTNEGSIVITDSEEEFEIEIRQV